MASAPGQFSPQRRRRFIAYLFLLPTLIMMGIFMFYPIGYVFYLSTTNYNLAFQNDYVGIQNYERLFSLSVSQVEEGESVRSSIPRGHGVITEMNVLGDDYVLSARDPDFWLAMRNSIYYLIATPILIVLSMIAAILVNQSLPGISFFRAGFYLPAITSIVAIGLMWRILYQQDGFLNQVLILLGLEPINWLTRPEWTLPSVIIVTIWRGIGFYMVIFLAGLQSIQYDLYEAAAIDGAGRIRQHLTVTIPGLRPSIVFVAIISSINALRAFDEVYVVAGEDGGVLNSARTAILYIYNLFDLREIGYAAAASVVFFLVTLALSILNLRYLERRT